MHHHHKKTSGLFFFTVFLLAAGMWLGARMSTAEAALSPYSAVYLETGDIYFGKLTRFPKMELSGVWYMERGQNSELGLVPFKNVFWAPEDRMVLNPDKVVMTARIKAESQLAKAMSGELTPAPPANEPAGDQPASPAGTLPEEGDAVPEPEE